MNIIDKYFIEFGEEQRPMAASVESLTYCAHMIESNKIKNILDSGSGLSSAFFHSKFSNVITVDHDPYWANKTRSFISSHINKHINIESITQLISNKFEFVFYDYGNIETRIFYFKQALELCTRFLYVDDMHVSYYSDYVKTKSRQYELNIIPETMDQYGRYGAMIVKQ
jgi:predicted O-methyltransferase YrrM